MLIPRSLWTIAVSFQTKYSAGYGRVQAANTAGIREAGLFVVLFFAQMKRNAGSVSVNGETVAGG